MWKTVQQVRRYCLFCLKYKYNQTKEYTTKMFLFSFHFFFYSFFVLWPLALYIQMCSIMELIRCVHSSTVQWWEHVIIAFIVIVVVIFGSFGVKKDKEKSQKHSSSLLWVIFFFLFKRVENILIELIDFQKKNYGLTKGLGIPSRRKTIKWSLQRKGNDQQFKENMKSKMCIYISFVFSFIYSIRCCQCVCV